jgi:hypothetical protein
MRSTRLKPGLPIYPYDLRRSKKLLWGAVVYSDLVGLVEMLDSLSVHTFEKWANKTHPGLLDAISKARSELLHQHIPTTSVLVIDGHVQAGAGPRSGFYASSWVPIHDESWRCVCGCPDVVHHFNTEEEPDVGCFHHEDCKVFRSVSSAKAQSDGPDSSAGTPASSSTQGTDAANPSADG